MINQPESPETLATRWLQEHGDKLYKYAKSRVSDHFHCEDLLQETLITAIDKWSTFNRISSELTWLTGILRFKILEFLKRNAKHSLGQQSNQQNALPAGWFDEAGHWDRSQRSIAMDWSPDPSLILDQKEFIEILYQCLDGLPNSLAHVFILREIEDLETSDILNDLQISQANLWVMLHRARNHLRLCMQSNWDFPSASLSHDSPGL